MSDDISLTVDPDRTFSPESVENTIASSVETMESGLLHTSRVTEKEFA